MHAQHDNSNEDGTDRVIELRGGRPSTVPSISSTIELRDTGSGEDKKDPQASAVLQAIPGELNEKVLHVDPSVLSSNGSTKLDSKHDVEKGPVVEVTESSGSAEEKPLVWDEGWRAYATLAGAFLVQYVTFGYVNAFGVYQDYYIRHYLTNYSQSTIGWIGGIQLFFTISGGTFAGPAFDKGYFYYLMGASLVLNSLSLFMLSLSHQNSFYQVFLAHGVTLGMSGGLVYVPSLAIPSHYFKKRLATAMSIPAVGAACGAILHPIMLNKLFEGKVGFHNGVRISAALNTVLFIIAFALMRTRLPPKKKGSQWNVHKWLREPSYVLVILAMMFVFLGLFYPVFYLQLTAVKSGVDENLAFYSLSILNAGSLIGRLSGGYIAEAFGTMNGQCFFTITSAGAVWIMIAIKNTGTTIVFALLYGFCSGGAISLTPPFVAKISTDMSELGTRLSFIFMIGGILALFSTTIAGELVGPEFDFTKAIIYSGVCLIAASIFFTASRTYWSRKIGQNIL